jgi:hypothetical protein
MKEDQFTMITKQTKFTLLGILSTLLFLTSACGSGADTEIDGNKDISNSTSQEQVGESEVGVTRMLVDHEVTLIGTQYSQAIEPIGNDTELLIVEFFIENKSQGIIDYALLYPFTLILPDETSAWDIPSCESKVPVGRLYLEPGTSTTYYLCWLVPPASEVSALLITYDYTAELVEGDTVSWEVHR